MKKFLFNFLGDELFKVFSLNALATFIKMLTGFLSIKVVAVLIGPSGVALLGQLTNFSSVFLTTSTGGINNGLTKYIAENKGNQPKINTFLSASFWITLSLSSFFGLILILFSNFFSNEILKDGSKYSIMIVFGLTIVFYGFNSILVSILAGYKQFEKYAQINIFSSITSLIFSIILTYFYGLYGALLSTVIYQSIVFIVTFFLCLKCDWFRKENFIAKFNIEAGKKLSVFSIMALVSACSIPVSQLIIRSYIVENISINDAGIWEGINRISNMYLMIVTSSLSVYYLPKLSELNSNYEIKNEIIKVYKLILPQILILGIVIYLFRTYIVKLLFNSSFSYMENLFFYQLIGDFLKIASWILAYQMLAKSMTRWFISTEIVFSITLVLLSVFFVNRLGIRGITIAYAINYFCHFSFMIFIFRSLIFSRSLQNNE
jgi:O-antigen/teichoic acid export membrane protein